MQNSFKAIFSNCWHSQENPCQFFVECINKGQRCHQTDSSAERVKKLKDELLLVEHEKPVVLIGMGTCGLANGAQKVYDTFEQDLKRRGIDAHIISTGCVGFCAKEVIVDIKLPGHPRAR